MSENTQTQYQLQAEPDPRAPCPVLHCQFVMNNRDELALHLKARHKLILAGDQLLPLAETQPALQAALEPANTDLESERRAEIKYLGNLLPLLSRFRVKSYDLRSQTLEFHVPAPPAPRIASTQSIAREPEPKPQLCYCSHRPEEHNDAGMCVMCMECDGYAEGKKP